MGETNFTFYQPYGNYPVSYKSLGQNYYEINYNLPSILSQNLNSIITQLNPDSNDNVIDIDKQAYATIGQTFNFNNNQLFQEQNSYTLEIYKTKQNANNLYLLVEILSNTSNNFNAPNSAFISTFHSNSS